MTLNMPGEKLKILSKEEICHSFSNNLKTEESHFI